MVRSPIIESYILKNELDAIPDAIANSNNYYKMQTMNNALYKLIKSGLVSTEEALKCSSNPDDLRLALSGLNHDNSIELIQRYQKKAG